MIGISPRSIRYSYAWLSRRAAVSTEEISLRRGDLPVDATYVTPDRIAGPLPGWIVLHGVTRPGRSHAQLVRFGRALAATGCAVLVPEVPEWQGLRLAPGVTLPTVRSAVRALKGRPEVRDGPVGLIGFSFGAPQALMVSSHPEVAKDLAGVVGFGGYCDLARTLRFMFTGVHRWNGTRHHLRPDPYGRWIVGANYLTRLDGYEDAGDVARALHRLAAAAGDVQLPAWHPMHEPERARLRETVHPGRRGLFDLFAPPTGQDPPRGTAEEMVERLAHRVPEVEPLLDPGSRLESVRHPVQLLHGRRDHLIPFSESLRLEARLPAETGARATVTRLFGHSAQDPFPGVVRGAVEGMVFLRALARVLATV